jgi:hypothetical protein
MTDGHFDFPLPPRAFGSSAGDGLFAEPGQRSSPYNSRVMTSFWIWVVPS